MQRAGSTYPVLRNLSLESHTHGKNKGDIKTTSDRQNPKDFITCITVTVRRNPQTEQNNTRWKHWENNGIGK